MVVFAQVAEWTVRTTCNAFFNRNINSCNEPKHESECPFCVFMKSGPCRWPFSQWQGCVEEVTMEDGIECSIRGTRIMWISVWILQ